MRAEKIKKEEVLYWVGEALREYKDGASLTVEVKRYVPLKTNAQLGLLFEAIEYFIKAQHDFYIDKVSKDEKDNMYLGLVGKYGFKKESGLIKKDEYGNERPVLIPIRLSKVNRLEQFEAIFNGLFEEAREQSIDMREWILRWEQIRKERANERNKV